MNIESKKAPLSQMRRQGKRVPEPARKDEKKSVKNTKRGGEAKGEDTKRGEAETRRESDEETVGRRLRGKIGQR